MKNEVEVIDGEVSRFGVAFWVIVPFLAFIAGVVQSFWFGGVDYITALLLFMFYMFTGLGITIGFHRCFTHSGFVIKKPWLKWLLAIAGSMAAEGPILNWVSWHRQHHQHGTYYCPHGTGEHYRCIYGYGYSLD
jgi:stearoyl-CoA desaturase (delta-9 desaturase)